MDQLLTLLFHVPTIMVTLLAAGLIMGQRHVGELSVFDLLTGITIGAVGGAGIVETDLPQLPVVLVIIALALLHWAVTWLVRKSPWFGRLSTFEPTVVIKDGKPLRTAMGRIQLTLSDLLPLLREQQIFDIRHVKIGVVEPDGKLSVIKQPGSPPPEWNAAVVVDGQVEEQVLRSLGWDRQRLRNELARRGEPLPEEIFLASLSAAGDLYVVPRGEEPEGPAIKH